MELLIVIKKKLAELEQKQSKYYQLYKAAVKAGKEVEANTWEKEGDLIRFAIDQVREIATLTYGITCLD